MPDDIWKNEVDKASKQFREATFMQLKSPRIFLRYEWAIFSLQQTSNAFKMKFWSTDDAPLIRPILNKSVYMAPPVAMSPMESPKLYAGLTIASFFSLLLTVYLIVAVFDEIYSGVQLK